MHLAILTEVYPPERHPTAVMARQLSRDLAQRGWDVTIVTGFPHHPHGKVFGGYRKQLLLRERDEGVEVLRTWHLTSLSQATVVRGAVYASQALGTAVGALLDLRPDVVLVWGMPLFGPLCGAAVARRHGASLVDIIYDIHPDVAIETGKLRSPLLIAGARAAEALQYRTADKIIVLSAGFERTMLQKGVPAAKLEVIPVWLDANEIRPLPRENDWRAEQGISAETFVVLYAGTIGLVSGAEIVVDVAETLRDLKDVLFLFVGDGQSKDAVEQAAEARGLDSMRFLPFQPRERLAELQATSDVSLVTLAPGRGRTSVPSKVSGYFAAGRPVVASVDLDSDTADQVRRTGAGIVCAPGDATALAQAVRALHDSDARRLAMGRAARAAFESTFARERVVARYDEVLRSVVVPPAANGASNAQRDVPSAGYRVRGLERGDVASVVDVHMTSFRGFFLTVLGPRFLRLYYDSIVRFGQLGSVAVDDRGRVLGFVVGIDNDFGFYRRLLSARAPAFALAAVPAALRQPLRVIPRLAGALFKRESGDGMLDDGVRVTTLTSIATLPGAKGVGRALMEAYREQAHARGFERIVLETDLEGNERVMRFYDRQGFSRRRQYVTGHGRAMQEFSLEL